MKPEVQNLVDNLPIPSAEKILLAMKISNLIMVELAKQQERNDNHGRLL